VPGRQHGRARRDQGLLKSSVLQIIGGEWYAAQHESPTNSRAFAEILQGKIITEIEEMHAFSRAENEAVKRVITVRKDRFAALRCPRLCEGPSSGPASSSAPRTATTGTRTRPGRGASVADPLLVRGAGSGAQQQGASTSRKPSRSIAGCQPMPCPVTRIAAQAAWWLMPEEETKAEQQERYDADPWMDVIAKFTAMLSSVTVAEVMQEALEIEIARFSRSDQMRVAACLRVLGWKQQNQRLGNRVLKVWKPALNVATVATGSNTQAVDSSIPF
jgi:hypothetical protein